MVWVHRNPLQKLLLRLHTQKTRTKARTTGALCFVLAFLLSPVLCRGTSIRLGFKIFVKNEDFKVQVKYNVKKFCEIFNFFEKYENYEIYGPNGKAEVL